MNVYGFYCCYFLVILFSDILSHLKESKTYNVINKMEIVSDQALMDLGWEQREEKIVSVPGFGYFPLQVAELLDNLTQV